MTDIAKALAAAGLRVKPLEWGATYFVVHSSGHFEFFPDEEEAKSRAFDLGRGHYTYDDSALRTYGTRLASAKDEWEREEKELHIQSILAALTHGEPT